MSRLILPEIVQHNKDLEAQLERVAETRRKGGFLREFDRQLKELDPRLSLVKAQTESEHPELMPGYWHVKRDNEGAQDSYFPICDLNGNFVEPNQGMLEWLKSRDLQRPGVLEEVKQARIREMEEFEKKKDRMREERRTEMHERYKNLANTSISTYKSSQGWRARGK